MNIAKRMILLICLSATGLLAIGLVGMFQMNTIHEKLDVVDFPAYTSQTAPEQTTEAPTQAPTEALTQAPTTPATTTTTSIWPCA